MCHSEIIQSHALVAPKQWGVMEILQARDIKKGAKCCEEKYEVYITSLK